MKVTLLYPTHDATETFENISEVDTEYGDPITIQMHTKDGETLTEAATGLTVDSVELEPDEQP